MKLSKAVIILFFIVCLQVSFFRLSSFLPIEVNFPLIALFIASYSLSASGIIILALITGIFIDLFSAVNFGASSLALVVVFTANSLLRGNVLKEKTFGEFILSGLATFFFYYAALAIFNILLNLPSGNNFSFNLMDGRIAEEIIVDLLAALAAYYFINHYQRRKYVAVWNIKKSI